MDFFVWSTIILGVWAPLGPLVGIRYGHELSKRLQSEHWVRDNEKQEYREVLGVLPSSFATIVRCGSAGVVIGPEEMRARNQAEQAALETLRDRLFIADKLNELNAFDRWMEATRAFDNDKDENLTLEDSC